MRLLSRIATFFVMIGAVVLTLFATAVPAQAAVVDNPGLVNNGSVQLDRDDTGAAVNLVQQRLKNAGIPIALTGVYDGQTVKAVKHFQWKFFLDDTGRVNRKTFTTLARIGATDRVPRVCKRKVRAICANQTQKLVRYYIRGKLVFQEDARYSQPASWVREGNHTIVSRQWDLTSSLYGTWMPRAMFFSGGQAFHYSPDFNRRGYNGGSKGCIGFRSLAIATKFYKLVQDGTFTKVYW